MRRFCLWLAALAVASVMPAEAAPVSVQRAADMAREFMQRPGMRQAPGGVAAQLTLAHQAQSVNGETDYYVFNRGASGGYIVVSGDDCALSVWGYRDSGSFDPEDIPDAMRWWLGEYQRQLEWLREHPQAAARRTTTLTTSVSPLLTTTWTQSAPYNNAIPASTYAGLGSRRPVAGCVAIAMAQIMKYHNHPTQGTGSHSYQWTPTDANGNNATSGAQTYSADFGTTTYDWANMANHYNSSANAPAVATLVYHVGVSVDMQYGVGGSGAQITDAASALYTYFNYDHSLFVYTREYYADDVWDQMMRDELDASRPILYGGVTAAGGGHAFVFDGYDTNGYFHVNWGWGGTSDGYFASTLLSPTTQGIGSSEGGYNTNQQAILGIKPDAGGQPHPLVGYCDEFSTNTASTSLGGTVDVKMSGVSFMGEGDLSLCYWGMQILTEDETSAVYTTYRVNASGITPGYTYGLNGEIPFEIPTGLPAGVYHLRPIYTLNSDGSEPTLFLRPAAISSYIKMTVVGDMAYFNDTPAPELLSLAELLASGDVNTEYYIADGDLEAVALSGDDRYLYCKDAGQCANPFTMPDGAIDYVHRAGLMGENQPYDQSNWIALELPEGGAWGSEVRSTLFGQLLQGVRGTLADKTNPCLTLTGGQPTAKQAGANYSSAPNVFVPANFAGTEQIGINGATYAFLPPRPNEVAEIQWAMWSDDLQCFTMPTSVGSVNQAHLTGSFQLGNGRYNTSSGQVPAMQDGDVFKFIGVITAAESPAQGMPRREGGQTPTYVVYPLNSMEKQGSVSGGVVTSVADGRTAPVEVSRHNVAGQPVDAHYRGIVIIRTSDGTAHRVLVH